MKRKVFAMLAVMGLLFLVSSVAFAEEPGGVNKFADYGKLAAGIGMALATFGGALGQGRTAASALEGIARNPNASGPMFLPMILGLVLIESLVIYSLVVAILILFT